MKVIGNFGPTLGFAQALSLGTFPNACRSRILAAVKAFGSVEEKVILRDKEEKGERVTNNRPKSNKAFDLASWDKRSVQFTSKLFQSHPKTPSHLPFFPSGQTFRISLVTRQNRVAKEEIAWIWVDLSAGEPQ